MEINNVGSQIPALPITLSGEGINSNVNELGSDVEQLSASAETAFASVFFSLLQNILSEAQNNSSA